MTKVAVTTTPIEVETQRIEPGPAVTVTGAQTTVSPTVTPACVDAENATIAVEVSAAPTVVETTIHRADVGVIVDGPIKVEASTTGAQGPQGPTGPQGEQGPPGPPGTGVGGSSFLPVPDLFDESDATYFYYGWTDVNGGWLVRRANRLTAAKLNATTGHPDLASAWANRMTLDYS